MMQKPQGILSTSIVILGVRSIQLFANLFYFYISVSVSLRDLILTWGPDDDAQGARGGRGQGPDGPGHLHLHPRLLSCHLYPLLPPENILLLAARQLVQGDYNLG